MYLVLAFCFYQGIRKSWEDFEMRDRTTSARTIFSIMSAAVIFGLAAGFPLGYIARQVADQSPGSNLALTQNNYR
jgi:hypothetical protein